MGLISNENLIKVLDILDKTYPDRKCALNHNDCYELIIAVTLSAQTTDKSVNLITPELFKKYPTVNDLANANISDVEELIKRIGMYRTKAKNIVNLAKMVVSDFDSKIPDNYDDLIKLPGVGRKTANVVLSVWYKEPRIAVDTHVFRVSNRIGIVNEKDVLNTEIKLMERIPKNRWSDTHHILIFHGRNICDSRKPKCEMCPIRDFCEYLK